MALPDVAALKRVLKIEHADEDTLVGELRARAIALVQGGKGGLGCPLEAVEMIFVDEAECTRADRVGVRSLIIPKTPIDIDSVAIVDASDTEVDTEDLRLDGLAGLVRYKDGSRFTNGPYEITCDVGLSAHPRYEVEFEAIVSAAVVDLVADLYTRRNPSQQTALSGGGNSSTFSIDGLPKRIVDSLEMIRQNL